MAIATSTALMLGGLAASGVGSAVQSKKSNSAAKKAAEQQYQGTQQASGYMREGLGQLGQLYSPYINQGAATMAGMGRAALPPAGSRYAAPPAPNAMPQGAGGGMPPNAAVPRGAMPGMGGGMPPGMGGTFAQMGPPPGMPPQQMGPDPRMMNTWRR
jgi:hypothetical protein